MHEQVQALPWEVHVLLWVCLCLMLLPAAHFSAEQVMSASGIAVSHAEVPEMEVHRFAAPTDPGTAAELSTGSNAEDVQEAARAGMSEQDCRLYDYLSRTEVHLLLFLVSLIDDHHQSQEEQKRCQDGIIETAGAW